MRHRLGVQTGWVVAPFAVSQIVRLGTSIVLARLLAPEMFGLMLIVNTLRTGTELLSDIGIGQSVVRARREPDRAFLDTAWTLQLARGILLTVLMLAVAGSVADLYGEELEPILLVVSGLFLLTGLQSPALFLMQRNIELRQRAAYDVICTVVQCALTIALSYVMPSVWALVWGLMLSTAFSTALSYVFGTRHVPRVALHPDHTREILNFGKWVFLATAIFFAATNMDRIFFGAALPIAAVGVYSIARTFSDMAAQLAQRLGALLVFPRIAGFRGEHHAAADRIRQTRRKTLALVALGMGFAIAGSDAFILLSYDQRYQAAAFMLPPLLVGVWFAVLATFADAFLLGCDRPAPVAYANAGKLGILIVGLPLALAHAGLFAGLLVLALAEIGRWLMLNRSLVRERLAFLGDDLALTALVIATAGLTKLALGAVGIVPDFAAWWALGSGAYG